MIIFNEKFFDLYQNIFFINTMMFSHFVNSRFLYSPTKIIYRKKWKTSW